MVMHLSAEWAAKWAALFHRHKGPYTLFAYGPVQWIRGKLQQKKKEVATNMEAEEVPEFACMLITDPRDEWESVYVWSESGQYWVTAFRLGQECPKKGE